MARARQGGGGGGGNPFDDAPLTVIHSGGGVGVAYQPLVSERTLAFDTAMVPTADVLYAYPMRFYNEASFNRLGLSNVSGGLASSRARVALYSNLANNMYPDALIVESGELNLAASGMKGGTVVGLAGPGIIWCVSLFNDGNGGPQASQNIANHLMPHGDPWNQVIYKGISKAQAYGAMPASFPAAGSWLVSASKTPPIVWAWNA